MTRFYEAKLVRRIEQGRAKLYVTNEILMEIEEVIKRPKFNQVMKRANLTPDQIMQNIVSFSHLAIAPKISVKVCRDPKDNKFLECLEMAKADYLVSGDEDLLSLKKHKEIPIVRTSKILDKLK